MSTNLVPFAAGLVIGEALTSITAVLSTRYRSCLMSSSNIQLLSTLLVAIGVGMRNFWRSTH